jgi:ATP-binding cassette subfamily F protein 3
MDEPTNHLILNQKCLALKKMKGHYSFLTTGFSSGMSNIVYEFRDQKIKEYLGDVNYFLEQRNLENMREVEKRCIKSSGSQESNKASYEEQKERKGLTESFEQIEKSDQAIEKDIQHDDKMLVLIITSTLKTLLSLRHTIKESGIR